MKLGSTSPPLLTKSRFDPRKNSPLRTKNDVFVFIMVKMDHIGLLTDHKEPKNRLKRDCVFGSKDMFLWGFFLVPPPHFAEKNRQTGPELLPCSKCLCACLLVCWYVKRVLAVCLVIEECFSLYLGYKTVFFSWCHNRQEQRLWSIWVQRLVNMEERQMYLNFQSGGFLLSITFFLFFASKFESLVLVPFCLPHARTRVDVPALKNVHLRMP